MKTLIVVNSPNRWPLDIPGVEVVSARAYLTDESYSGLRGARLFNLCRSYRYQSTGYYVSLLAAARGHKPMPSITTILDMRSQRPQQFVPDDVEEVIRRSLAPIRSNKFDLSIYFGRNVAKRYDRLASRLFKLFQAPLLRANFEKREKWILQNIRPISTSEIPEEHRPYIVEFAQEYLAGRRFNVLRRIASRYDLAILYNPTEVVPPSDERALKRFTKAGESLGLGVELIQKEDYGRLAEFDALFIRETTHVDHHTYRFSRRAAAEGLVVIDDPESILRCTNKVYLAELLNHRNIPTPRTIIVHRDNMESVAGQLGLPCILKKPDSAFSQGVTKVEEESFLLGEIEALLEKSDLVIAQEFLPTPFDWRVGVLDGQPLYVCKYFMARKHWQIIQRDSQGKQYGGKVETMSVEDAPAEVIRAALRAAGLIGDGLYGVDLKVVNGKCYIIEVNDNPSIEAGYEDQVLKGELYVRIMKTFLDRIERRKQGAVRA